MQSFENLLERDDLEVFLKIKCTLYYLRFTNQYIILVHQLWGVLNLNVSHYNLGNNYLLKLPTTNICWYGTQAVYFKGSLP